MGLRGWGMVSDAGSCQCTCYCILTSYQGSLNRNSYNSPAWKCKMHELIFLHPSWDRMCWMHHESNMYLEPRTITSVLTEFNSINLQTSSFLMSLRSAWSFADGCFFFHPASLISINLYHLQSNENWWSAS